jgi:hypothetical protein
LAEYLELGFIRIGIVIKITKFCGSPIWIFMAFVYTVAIKINGVTTY